MCKVAKIIKKIEPKRDDQGLNLGSLTRYMYVLTNRPRVIIVRKEREIIVKGKEVKALFT